MSLSQRRPLPPAPLARIQRIAAPAECLAFISALLLLGGAAYLFTEPDAMRAVVAAHATIATEAQATLPSLRLAWVILMVPLALLIAALLTMRRLFRHFRLAELFVADVPRLLGRLGKLALAIAVSSILARTLGALVLSLDAPAGQRQLVIGFSSTDLAALIIGVLFFALAMVLEEAMLIAEDHRGFV